MVYLFTLDFLGLFVYTCFQLYVYIGILFLLFFFFFFFLHFLNIFFTCFLFVYPCFPLSVNTCFYVVSLHLLCNMCVFTAVYRCLPPPPPPPPHTHTHTLVIHCLFTRFPSWSVCLHQVALVSVETCSSVCYSSFILSACTPSLFRCLFATFSMVCLLTHAFQQPFILQMYSFVRSFALVFHSLFTLFFFSIACFYRFSFV